MVRKRFIPVQLFTLCFLLIIFRLYPVELSAADQPAWLEIHSPHLVVITDAGDKKGREVALRFEQMRAVFANLLTKDRLNQPRPLTILALKNDKAYYQAAPLRQGQPIDVPSFSVPGEDQDFFVLNLFEEEPWRAVAHDFAHLLLNANYPLAQGWFDEGLAEYFSSIRVDNKQVEMGADPELRGSVAEDLLQNQRETHPPKSLTELLGANVWLSIPDLFTMKHDSSTYTEGTHHTLFYAESWMVMHYLLNQKKLPETGAYFDLVLNQQVPVEEAVQKAYGMTAAQFEQAVKDYFHSQSELARALDNARQKNAGPNPANSAQPYQFPVPVGPDDIAIESKPLPESDARAIYAEVQVRLPERREYGLKELQALTTTPPVGAAAAAKKSQEDDSEAKPGKNIPTAGGNEIAHRVLAWDHIQHAEFEQAMAELSDAAILNPRDLWIRYYLSVLKYRMAQAKHGDIQGLPNMMQDLRAILEWYPEFADAYDLMAVARMEGGGSSAAMQAERAAMQLNPRDQRYNYHLAEIYIADKQWDAATAQLERLKNSSNAGVAADAREKLDQIASERKYGIPGASRTTTTKLEVQKSPFDVLEQDAAKRAGETGQGSENGPDKRTPKFVKGRLLGVDCSKAPAATLTVASEAGTLKLHTPDYKSLLLIGADDFSCDWHDRAVSLNYKPGGTMDGDLVSLELR